MVNPIHGAVGHEAPNSGELLRVPILYTRVTSVAREAALPVIGRCLAMATRVRPELDDASLVGGVETIYALLARPF